jgi:plasmid stabilization system protein ParE
METRGSWWVTRYQVVFAATADRNLRRIYLYFSRRFSAAGAERFVRQIVDDCHSLGIAPLRGHLISEDVRILGVAGGRVSILYKVENQTVTIVNVHYAGRDHEAR